MATLCTRRWRETRREVRAEATCCKTSKGKDGVGVYGLEGISLATGESAVIPSPTLNKTCLVHLYPSFFNLMKVNNFRGDLTYTSATTTTLCTRSWRERRCDLLYDFQQYRNTNKHRKREECTSDKTTYTTCKACCTYCIWYVLVLLVSKLN